MIHLLRRGADAFEVHELSLDWTPPEDTVWIDLKCPTREEELAVERTLGIELPTPEEMAQIEPSSRLYQDHGATFLTASLVANSGDGPHTEPVTFVLKGLMVTLRYDEFRAFTVFRERAPKSELVGGAMAFFGLLDAVVERLAQLLDLTGEKVEGASGAIFRRPESKAFEPLMTDLAKAQSVTALARGSLVSISRLLAFAGLAPQISEDRACMAHLKSLQADVQSLTEHSAYQSSHIAFLLDAALGLINIEQNGIIKFFSVIAVIFLPPTLVASIYGMNFKHMPELDWVLGYPMAICLMVASAVLPLWWFKKRGWM
jgi:magnesium transporter